MQLTAVCTVSIYIITCPYRNHVYFIFEVLLCSMAIPMTWTQTATLVKVTLATGGIGIDDVEVEWSESDCTVDIRG